MQTLTVVMFALCVASSMADLPGCDKDIIKNIKTFWTENGTPTKIMETLAKNGKGLLAFSTKIVPLADVPVKNPKCVKGEFTKTTAKFSIVPRKSEELNAAKATTSYKVTEKKGIVIENGGKTTKYIISNENGITVFYSCDPKSKTKGDPAVGVAVAVSKYQDVKDELKTIKSIMSVFGILEEYPVEECAK